jgi:hypothetical protein
MIRPVGRLDVIDQAGSKVPDSKPVEYGRLAGTCATTALIEIINSAINEIIIRCLYIMVRFVLIFFLLDK